MDAGPKPLVLSIVEDVTERRRQEKEIARANSFLSAIVQNAPIGLYARGQDGRMLLRNKQCEHIFGEVSEESFDATGSLPHETPEQVHEYIMREREVLDAGKTLNIPEEEYLTAGGEKKLLHMVKVPVDGGNGEPQFVVTLVEDITERKAQERTLVETKTSCRRCWTRCPWPFTPAGRTTSFLSSTAARTSSFRTNGNTKPRTISTASAKSHL